MPVIGVRKPEPKTAEAKTTIGVPADTGRGIFVVRHGKTALNSDSRDGTSPDRIRGWKDVPLDAAGKEQAKELVTWAKKIKPVAIYSSNLQRASDIANAIGDALGIKVEESNDFRPWDVGKWTGQSSKEAAPFLAKHVADPEKPVDGGETFATFRDRALGAFQKLMDKYKGQNIIVVSHYRDLALLAAWFKAGASGDKIDEEEFNRNHTEIPPGAAMRLFPAKGKWSYDVQSATEGNEKKAPVGVPKPPTPSSPRIGLVQAPKTDTQGGMYPVDPEMAKDVDFITLPEGISGTNCLNCDIFVREKDGKHYCSHPEVSKKRNQPVTDRDCCKEWDAKGTLRHFGKENGNGQGGS